MIRGLFIFYDLRKVEGDWNKAYLSRTEGNNEKGSIAWKFKVRKLEAGEYNLTFAPPSGGGEKKSKIRKQGREFKTNKEKEG